MGLWSFLTGTPSPPSSFGAPALAAPGSGDSLAAAIVGDIFGALPKELITREVAQRVPELKRALSAHQALVAPLRFEKYENGKKTTAQPYWVGNCDYPGMSRYIAFKKLTEELFWEGLAVLACRLDTEGHVYDWVPVPRSLWSIDNNTQKVTLHESIPAEFRQRIVLVPLGANGLMVDGIDSIRQARKLELARQNRLDSPPASTELHITDTKYDEMTREEQAELVAAYVENRNKYSVSVTKSFVEVKERGTTGQLDLFEDATASLSRALAMHAGVPSSFVESAAKGGGGAMSYSNENDRHSELWTYGSAAYAYAIVAALSGDDVVGPGAEVRADLSHFSVPAPTAIDPEAGDASTEVQP
ncbi:hypothetical protein [Microbacterium sp. 22296]|uniref:hypothetical protein n=1 Tax=Microbacterium sp. 22296 TaxID=3453903 RepID=UPI003F83C5DD